MERNPTSRAPQRMGHLSLSQFGRRAALSVFVGVLIVGVVTMFALSIQTWFAAYLGILLAIFIRTLSVWLSRHTRLPDQVSVIAVLVILLCLIALAGWWLAQPLTQEITDLQKRVPEAIDSLRQHLHSSGLDRFIPNQMPDQTQLAAAGGNVLSKVMKIFSVTFQSIVTLLVVLFLGIYIAFSPGTYKGGIVSLFPISKRDRACDIIDETTVKLRNWIFGQIVSMAAVGVMIGFGLYFAGVPLPIVLGFIAGLLDIIPIFGPIIAGIPAILLGLTVSPWHALYAVLVFVGANQIEQHLLIPIVQRYSVSLPPALTVFALLLLGSLFGFWGMLLAAPMAATLLVLVKRIYVSDVLGDRTVKKSG